MAEDKKATPNKPHRAVPISIGDCALNFTADTTDLDKCVNETVERLERALAAFKKEWNTKLPPSH